MKKLFTFVSLMAFTSAMFAQDPSKWEVGQDVSAEVGLKELGDDFSGQLGAEEYGRFGVTSIGNTWKGSAPNEFRKSSGEIPTVFGFYNLSGNLDFYQIVKVPAGSYTVESNALYREGTPQDNFKNRFNGKKFKYGHMFANLLEDDQTTVSYVNDVVITSIADVNQHSRIHEAGDWMADTEIQHAELDPETQEMKTVLYYSPSCCEGFAKYFAAGHYYNTKKFVTSKDCYVKVGFAKTGTIPQEELAFGNLKIVYQGPADANSLKELAKEELVAVLGELEELAEVLDDAGFEALSGALFDIYDKMDTDRRDADTDALNQMKASVEQTIIQYQAAKDLVLQLADLFDSCDDMLASTEFGGKDAFASALSAQKALGAEKNAEKIGDPIAYYKKIINDLSVARASYLNNQEPNDKGAKNFGSLIKHPWFVNPEYTPSDDTAVGGDYWHLTAEGWTDWEAEKRYDEKKQGKTDIASKVDFTIDTSVTGQWYKYQHHNDGWNENTGMFFQGRLICIATGWSTGFRMKGSDEPAIDGCAQKMIGLPNGYYSVGCLIRTWDASGTWEKDPQFAGCFGENSKGERVTSTPSHNGKFFDWGSSPETWDDVESSVLLVEDGQLLIGGGASISNCVTGFKLYFYGETPDFPGLAQKKAEELAALSTDGFFKGDIAHLNELLSSVKHPVTDAAAYEAAYNTFTEYQKYYTMVSKKMADYTAVKTVNDIVENWANPAYELFNNAVNVEGNTYELVDGYNALANAYKSYYDQTIVCDDYKDDPVIKELLATQQSELSKEVSTVERLNAFVEALKTPTRLLQMKSLGCDKASEANPVNVSTVLNNPTFDENWNASSNKFETNTGGWSETPSTNDYARGNGEFWDKAPFTFSQKIANLPAGTYKLRVKAIYRNSEYVTDSLRNDYAVAGGEEKWADHNAKLFAKTSETNGDTAYIKSIYAVSDQKVPSFDLVATNRSLVEGVVINNKVQTIQDQATFTKVGDEEVQFLTDGAYPFDSKLGEGDALRYYPASMYGFAMACKNFGDKITSEVTITIEQGDVLEVGIFKDKKIDKDWVIFDDFELEYLSGDSFARVITGINTVADSNDNSIIFNVAGQRVNENFKGIVIKNGAKVLNK